MTTIVVSGALANKPGNGGEAWVRLNWLLGFQKLGYRVYFVEEIQRATCVDGRGAVAAFADCVNLAYFKDITRQFGLDQRAALIYEGGEQIFGPSRAELLEVAESADLLVNISGHLAWEAFFSRLRRKAFIDIDPGFTQFWQAAGNPRARLAGHDVYFTIGANIGRAGCAIPTCGTDWKPIRPPVVLEEWPAVPSSPRGQGVDSQGLTTQHSALTTHHFTTVANWRGSYGPVQHEGKTYGLKVHEFRKFLELPRRTRQKFEIALSIHPADDKDRQALVAGGWQLADPQSSAADAQGFRNYVQNSAAEFSVAQGIYVETKSGWFSDRSACYLASGKPALVQDTGFGGNYPVGEGLLAFRTLEEAVAGAQEIEGNYQRHCRAARALAEAYFDSDKVLTRLLEEAC